MPVSQEAFREAMGRMPSAVTIVSVQDPGGPMGMTASAVCSLSLEPPMLLVCVARDALIHDQIVRADVFGIDVLGESQRDLARRFADRASHRWDNVTELSPHGMPLLAGSLAHVDCRRDRVFPGGDHSIVTGIVEWVRASAGQPLTYFRRSYGGFAP